MTVSHRRPGRPGVLRARVTSTTGADAVRAVARLRAFSVEAA
jgi:hypothetical protein